MDRPISKEMLDEDRKIAAEMSSEEEDMKKKIFLQTVTDDIRDDSFHRLLRVLEMSNHFAKTLLKRLEKQKGKNLQLDNARFWNDEMGAAHNEDKYSRTINGQPVSDRQPSLMTSVIMHPFQIDGYLWLKSLYENGVNGILADEMGLGKTLQCIALIGYLTEMGIGGPFLVCAPLSILPTWISEVKIYAPSLSTVLYHGSPLERAKHRRIIKKNKNVLVFTSYEIVVRDRKYLQDYKWKYLILDEGHRIKNYRCCLVRELKLYHTANRLLLTGTPLQNDLSELWSMLNFLLPEIFTDLHSFESWFDIVVLQTPGMEDELLQREKETRIVATMHDILTPFLLRRTKDDVNIKIPPKKEVLVCLSMTTNQKLLYQDTLVIKAKEISMNEDTKKKPEELTTLYKSGKKRTSNGGKKGAIKALKTKKYIQTWMDRINSNDLFDSLDQQSGLDESIQTKENIDFSNHQAAVSPFKHRLRSHKATNPLTTSNNNIFKIKEETTPKEVEKPQRRIGHNVLLELLKIANHPFLIMNPDDWSIDEDLVLSSRKMLFLDQLLPHLKQEGHRVLIYSQLILMLDILEKFCELRNFRFVRLDGSMSMRERQESLNVFSSDKDVFLFLLSTRAGGLGLNLLSADTVVLFDSDWNPQRDLQAQDRCHRIGQMKPVVVYRLMIENSVDQKVLEKACSKRKLEKMIIKRGRFLTGCHDNEMTPADLSDVLKDEDYSLVVRLEESLTRDQLERLTDRSDLTELN